MTIEMNYLFIYCLLLGFACNPTKDAVTIDKIVAYKYFYNAGTTSLLKNIFDSPSDYLSETALIQLTREDIESFECIISEAKVKKHVQKKIIVDLALVVTIQGLDHYWVISQPDNVIVDLTTNRNYWLNTNKLKDKTRKLLQKYTWQDNKINDS
jgi:hypothetical protein